MSNIYHILDKVPSYDAEDIEEEYENLSNKLVYSGLMKIDADDRCNFVRYTNVALNTSKTFSFRELNDSDLLPKTLKKLQSIMNYRNSQKVISEKILLNEIERLRSDFKNVQLVNLELELKLARLFVQSAHPIVILWLLKENIEVYISYSHIIGDVMDIPMWKIAGQNSGMQSIGGSEAAIFVACGGDPFRLREEKFPKYGDGWPAIARLQIIAAQELGHYADLIRDSNGYYVSRHSADIYGRRANVKVQKGREEDIAKCKNFLETLDLKGLSKLIKQEESLRFYRNNKVRHFRYFYHLYYIWWLKRKLLNNATKSEWFFIKRFKHEQYLGIFIKALIADMLFNLSPKADVYTRENKQEEEAIACVEALARVPQQVMKWGRLAVKFCMGNLYNIYYKEVIPYLINDYNSSLNTNYTRNYNKTSLSIIKRIIKLLKSFKKDPLKPQPHREI